MPCFQKVLRNFAIAVGVLSLPLVTSVVRLFGEGRPGDAPSSGESR